MIKDDINDDGKFIKDNFYDHVKSIKEPVSNKGNEKMLKKEIKQLEILLSATLDRYSINFSGCSASYVGDEFSLGDAKLTTYQIKEATYVMENKGVVSVYEKVLDLINLIETCKEARVFIIDRPVENDNVEFVLMYIDNVGVGYINKNLQKVNINIKTMVKKVPCYDPQEIIKKTKKVCAEASSFGMDLQEFLEFVETCWGQ